MEILLRYLNPQKQVVRVGLAESWRIGLSVVLRQLQPHAFCKRQIPPQPFVYSRVIIAMQAERLFLVSFSVKIRHRDQVALIDVSGHLTFFEVGALRESIQSLLKAQRKNIILNLSGLVYLDGNEGNRPYSESGRSPQNHSSIPGFPGISRRTIRPAKFPGNQLTLLIRNSIRAFLSSSLTALVGCFRLWVQPR